MMVKTMDQGRQEGTGIMAIARTGSGGLLWWSWRTVLLLLSCLANTGHCGGFSPTYSAAGFSKNVTMLLDSLLAEYDRRIRPGHGGPATTIMVNMNVRSMGPFSEKQESYAMQLYLRQVWYDPRLRFNRTDWGKSEFSMNWLFAKKLWKPDSFFINGKNSYAHAITAPNTFIRLKHDGQITWSLRLTVRASCKMHLRKFPLDTQICPLSIASYGYNKKDMVYRWTSETPVSVDGDVSIAQYELVNISVSSATLTVRRTERTKDEEPELPTRYNKVQVMGHITLTGTSREEISILGLKFYLKRLTGFFLLQVYVPCILIVCCSWVAFWITKKDVPGRVALGVTTVLSMTTLGFGGRSAWPAVSYATALDYFVILCFAFVFAAVLEFACINFVERAANKRRIKYEKLKQTIRDRITAAENDGKMLVTTTITEEDINVHGSLKDALKIPLTVVPLSIPTIDEGEDETVVSAQAEVDAGLREALRLQLSVVPESVDAVQEEDKSPSSEEDKQKDGEEGAKDGTGGSVITDVGTDPAAGSEDGALDQTGGTSDLTVISVDLEEEEDEESEPPPPPPPFTVWQILTRKRHIMKHMTLANSVPTEDELLDSFSIIDVWARRLFPSSFFILFTTYWIMFNYYITDEFPNEGKQPADGLIVV